MTSELGNDAAGQEGRFGGCLLWFLWGISLSFMTILSVVLLALLTVSIGLNIYLGWELSGLEVSVSRPGSQEVEPPLSIIPTDILTTIPTNTPTPLPPAPPSPLPTMAQVEQQLSTVEAIATEIASASQPAGTRLPALSPTPVVLQTAVSTAVAIGTPAAQTSRSETGREEPSAPSATTELSTAVSPTAEDDTVISSADEFAPYSSSNTYSLIPIDGSRDKRPAEEHGDLNLKLREPEKIDVDLSLIEIPGSGIDPNAPDFGDIFEPKFSSAYTVRNWDWACNCPGDVLKEDNLVIVGLETTPGEPVFIPPTAQDIYGGDFYALVLYAAEDSLTFAYSRDGTVAHSYTIHYQGLRTDPNLLALYLDSTDSELPGLTLDTPVGIATDELIVAVRDKGVFLDARSQKDWWE